MAAAAAHPFLTAMESETAGLVLPLKVCFMNNFALLDFVEG